MTSRASLIALGVGAYLAFAIASFPAAVAHRWFAPDELKLAAVEGTVWRGSAAYGGFNDLAFSDLDWQLHPAALLTGALSLTVEAGVAGGLARTDLVLRGSHMTLSNFRASVSLASLDALLPFRGVSGTASLTLERLELIDGWPVVAAGTARVAGLSGPPIFPVAGVTTLALGNYFARIESGNEGSILAVVNDEGGPIELTDGRAILNSDRSYRLEALIKPRPDAHAAVVDGLQIFPANAAGQHVITDQGQL